MPMTRSILFRCLALATIFIPIAGSAPAVAEENDKKPPSAEDGRALAEKLCGGCHLTGAERSGAAPVGPPPFVTIANMPGQTAERIKGALIQPHPPMPDMQLTQDEMRDIIAYLDTLRTDKSTPLLAPPADEKPKTPAKG